MSPNSNGLPFTAEQLQQFAAKGRFFYTPGNTSMPDLTSSTWRDDCLRQQQDVMVKAEEATLKRPLAEIPARSQQEVVKEAHKQRAEVLKEMKEGKTVEPIVMGYKRPFSTTPLSDLTPSKLTSPLSFSVITTLTCRLPYSPNQRYASHSNSQGKDRIPTQSREN